MMSVKEYAEDVNKSISSILILCKELGINVTNEDDMLEDIDITNLDNSLDDIKDYDLDEAMDDVVTDLIEEKNIKLDDSIKKQKLKKKSQLTSNNDKKAFLKEKKEMYKNKGKLVSNEKVDNSIILYKDNMTVQDLANSLSVNSTELVRKLFDLGLMININSSIDYDTASLLVTDYNKELKKEETQDVTNFENYEVIDKEEDLSKRPCVVTIMGHVDHGKTTLLDTIRKANVADLEAGGITQAVSAYQVNYNGNLITFVDTPGHAAFTEMRARGAKMTDIIVIIAAADDGVMPQTKEVIDHAKASGVPIIVAINKIDKPNVNVERVMTQFTECGITPDSWGGETIFVPISAKTGLGVNELLDSILLVADINNYRANPNRYAMGTVIESRLDKHVGSVCTILIQNGTLRLGDPVVIGTSFGKIRTMKNDQGNEIIEALPSTPVEVTGITEVPQAGDKFMAFETEKQAKNVAETRKETLKEKNNNANKSVSLDELFNKINEGLKEINVIIKADVNGSAEAVKNSLEKIEVEGVKVKVIRSSVGAITESDIVLAKASNALIIGFNIRPNNSIKDYALFNNVEIRLYNIIYKAVEEMEQAMKGMLEPTYVEKVIGEAKVKQIFKFSKVGNIAGSYVTEGIIKNDAKVRVIRDSIVIYDGNIGSLQREKDTVKEVKKGLECGITIENFNDIKVDDIFEVYEMVESK